MNEHIKAWLAALRSGQYPQDGGNLRTSKGFCCVGVECDIVDPHRWNATDIGYTYGGDPEYFHVPNEIQTLSGFSSRFYVELYALNDETRASFEEIADYIEASIKDGTAFE